MPDAICYIVGAGENTGLDFTPGIKDYVIAADGGLKHLAAAGIGADLVIGDFDTLGARPDHPHTVALPPEKDETDTYAALREGMRLGYGVFHIYGGTGGRLEHTLANIQLLAYLAEKNMRGFLFGSGVVLTAVKDGAITFGAGAEGSVSVFSLTEKSCGVYLRGLKYL
jgi:thiamine pyrophosphokinase